MLLKLNSRYFFLSSFLLLAIIFFYHFSFIRSLNNIVSSFLYPFVFVQNKITLHTNSLTMNKSKLLEEYNDLKKAFENILQENIQLKSLENFNQETAEIIDFNKRYIFENSILSQVIFKHFDSGSHYFLVDKGSTHNIKPDMVAIYKNIIIGRVVKVFPCYSKIMLISDHTCRISVYCDKTKTAAIYQGKNNLKEATLNHVSHLKNVELEEMVFSSGEGLIYPKGFAIAKTTNIETAGVNQIISVDLLADLENINYVYLIQKE